jgi:TnpA family transposase
VTEETLDEAIASVINAYAAIDLHKHWGSGDTASADGIDRRYFELCLFTPRL